jgi:hypothetical protein
MSSKPLLKIVKTSKETQAEWEQQVVDKLSAWNTVADSATLLRSKLPETNFTAAQIKALNTVLDKLHNTAYEVCATMQNMHLLTEFVATGKPIPRPVARRLKLD